MAAKKKRPAAHNGRRGSGIADQCYTEDYGDGTKTFKVDTFITRRQATGAKFDLLIRRVKGKQYENNPAMLQEMVDFLDSEIDALRTAPSEALKAKNIFRGAFGAPFLASGAVRKRAKPK